MALEDTCCFGFASGPDGSGLIFKLLGRGNSERDYTLVLEATDVLHSYIAKFSLEDLIEAVTDESGVVTPAGTLLGWLRQRFDGEVLEAALGAHGLQLAAVHSLDELAITIRLPPAGPVRQLPDAQRTAWVAQDVLFTQNERLRTLQRKLEECEQRCPASQQFDDAISFLAGLDGGTGDAAAADGGTAVAAPRASLHKRKRTDAEEEAAPVSGSAVKSARPSGAGAHAAGGAAAAAAEGAPGAVGPAQQPAASQQTQQTGGRSTQTQRTDTSTVGAPIHKAGRGRAPMGAGRGRGRGRGRATR